MSGGEGARRPVGRPPDRRDALLRLWAEYRLMPGATFVGFAATVGMKPASWERAFYRAKAAGDPNAVREPRRAAA